MRRSGLRHAFQVALALAAAGSLAACDQDRRGAVRVGVIGDTPTLADPNGGPLTPGQALLLSNVAQGLVRFDARGQIEPGLAERWTVSDDGLSYIFRLGSGAWQDGSRLTAHQVARILRRAISAGSANPLKDTLGAVDEIVAMTDRVIEVRLSAPRPNLLQLLAQPEFGVMRNGQGTGPFAIADGENAPAIRLRREITPVGEDEGEAEEREELLLRGTDAQTGVRRFVHGELDLLLGGTHLTLPYARQSGVPRTALQFDPVAGLFGLVASRRGGPLDDPQLRRLLAQAIDREALAAAFNVPGLVGRATILEPGLEAIADPVAPVWSQTAIGQRRPGLIEAADRFFADEERPVLKVALPEGPGATILLDRLRSDWSLLGIGLERVGAADRSADLRVIDLVAPSGSPAWYLRHFRCAAVPICSEEADKLLEAARDAPVIPQRSALLAEAARLMDEDQLFIPLAAPIRWSLVSGRIEGFAGNRFARHTLTGLEQRLNREGAE